MKLKIQIYSFGKIKSIYADEETNQFTIEKSTKEQQLLLNQR